MGRECVPTPTGRSGGRISASRYARSCPIQMPGRITLAKAIESGGIIPAVITAAMINAGESGAVAHVVVK